MMTKEEIAREFEIPLESLNEAEILVAEYSTGNYEGHAFVLYRQDGNLYEVNASHCSCYALEGQWGQEITYRLRR